MTQNLPPEGWYPDAQGTARWWDGSEWTERVQDESAQATDRPSPAATAPSSSTGRTDPLYKRKWFIGVAAAIVGIGLGAAGASGAAVADTPEYKSLQADLASSERDIKDLAEEMAPMQDKVAAMDDREKDLDAQETEVAERESSVKAGAEAVKKREKKVGIVETEIENNTISGEGTYLVGEDIKAGTYKSGTPDSGNCYWQISPDANGSDITANNNSSGQSLVSVKKGQYLILSGCNEFVKK